MTWLAVVLGIFAVLGWRLAYVWWAETTKQAKELDRLQSRVAELLMDHITETELEANELTCARSIILRHAMSGKCDRPLA